MDKIIITIIFVAMAVFIFFIARKNKGKNYISWTQFYAKGKEAGFSNKNIKLMKRLAQHSGLEHPAALFWSQVQMDRCIKNFIQEIKAKKTEFLPDNQEFLARLYDFRKKMELDRPIYRNGIKSSHNISELQTVQVVVANVGVFKSKIVNNKAAFISIERPDSSALPVNFIWKQKLLSVYFWRKNDAGYCFETNVIGETFTNDPPLLTLSHSDKLIRTQSRKSLRVKTHRAALLYRIEEGSTSSKSEVTPGIKCYLEDISDCGCAVTAGGTAPSGFRVVVQFTIDKTPISISGVVRSVDYNETKKISTLHIEADLIPMSVKNKIFSIMFGMLIDDVDIVSIGSGDKEHPEIQKDDSAENLAADHAHAFDYHESRVGEISEDKPVKYDDRHIEDKINWDEQSKTKDDDN
ncbi:MAG: PilZ domain-containing protein [Spirochaetaceae bacterium]|nr:PilZ domain-containing protein [Spirochaetaceae bacterium]